MSVAELDVLDPDAGSCRSAATAALHALVDLYDRGMREPLPIYCATSAAWARAARSLDDPVLSARSRWETPFDAPPNEDRDLDHVLVLGRRVDFGELATPRPLADESGGGWDDTETTRLGRLARRLWDPVLDHERLQEG